MTTKVSRTHRYGDDDLHPEDQEFAGHQTGVRTPLFPQAWTRFRRIALVGIETRERVTIDLDLVLSAGGRDRTVSDVAILEVKQWPYSRGTPVMSALRAAGCRPSRISKYCAAIAFSRPDLPCNRLRPGLRALERRSA